MDKEIQTGKIIAGIIIAILLLIDVAVIAFSAGTFISLGEMAVAMQKLFTGFIRLILEIGLLVFFYKGHKWAKWLLVVLFLLGGLLSVFSLLMLFNILSFILCASYIIIPLVIIFSRSLNEFLYFQRNS